MKADRGLTIERMVELGGVSRSGFYRFNQGGTPRPDGDMELRDAIHRIALEWPRKVQNLEHVGNAQGGGCPSCDNES